MAWFKVDDKLHDHRKTRRVLRGWRGKRRDAATIGLWTLAGSWCADNLTDGFVPTDELSRWDDEGEALAQRLVEAGLWHVAEVDGEPGFRFHEWDERQPTKAEVEQKRADARARMTRVREHRRTGSSDVRANTDGTCDEVRSTPSRPDPSRPDPTEDADASSASVPADAATTTTALAVVERPDVERLCTHLADRIEANGANRPQVTGKWRDAARLMLDRDQRTEDQIHTAIDWCQEHEFWRSNILSMPKLRDQYEQLRLQASRGRTLGPTTRQQETDALFQRAAERMGVTAEGLAEAAETMGLTL